MYDFKVEGAFGLVPPDAIHFWDDDRPTYIARIPYQVLVPMTIRVGELVLNHLLPFPVPDKRLVHNVRA